MGYCCSFPQLRQSIGDSHPQRSRESVGVASAAAERDLSAVWLETKGYAAGVRRFWHATSLRESLCQTALLAGFKLDQLPFAFTDGAELLPEAAIERFELRGSGLDQRPCRT
jgi:hypothetical protein